MVATTVGFRFSENHFIFGSDNARARPHLRMRFESAGVDIPSI